MACANPCPACRGVSGASTETAGNDLPKLIPAIEVCRVSRRPFSKVLVDDTEEPLEGFRVTLLGLAPPREALYERIDRRAKQMFAEGILEEAEFRKQLGPLRGGVISKRQRR